MITVTNPAAPTTCPHEGCCNAVARLRLALDNCAADRDQADRQARKTARRIIDDIEDVARRVSLLGYRDLDETLLQLADDLRDLVGMEV